MRRATLLVVAVAAMLLAAAPISAGTVSLAWDPVAASDLAGYRVFYGTSAGNYTSQLDAGTATWATVSGLNDCTTYWFAVKAYDTQGLESEQFSASLSGWGRPVVGTASPAHLSSASPVSLTIGGTNFRSGAQVRFSDTAIVASQVQVRSCTEIVVTATVGSGVPPGAVGVSVVNPDGTLGSASGLLVVDDVAGPTISAVSVGSITGTTAVVSWRTSEPADGIVRFRRTGESTYQVAAATGGLVTDHSVTVEGLSPQTGYEFHVVSADADGNDAASPNATFTTAASAYHYLRIEPESATITAPVAITAGGDVFRGAHVTAAGTAAGTATSPAGTVEMGVHVPHTGSWTVWLRMWGTTADMGRWFESIDGGNFVSRGPTAANTWEWVEARTYSLGAGLHTLQLGGYRPGARVDRVLVTDDPAFRPTEMPGADIVAPSGVGQLVVTAAAETATRLTWRVPNEADVRRVVVRYRTDGRFPETPVDGLGAHDAAATPGANGSLDHTGLATGTTYSYAVFTIDASGNASDPETGAATPVGVPPGTVQNLRRTDVQ